MTVEISGTAKLRDMGPLTEGGRSVGITLPNVSAKFYKLRPGMYCEFRVTFPEKQDIIEADEVDAIIARQKQHEKIDKLGEQKLRQWYEERKEIYERCRKNPALKMPEDVRRLFEEPGEMQKALNELADAEAK